MITKPSTMKLATAISDYLRQYNDGLITECEWVSASINDLMEHYGAMRQYTMQEALEWQANGTVKISNVSVQQELA